MESLHAHAHFLFCIDIEMYQTCLIFKPELCETTQIQE